MDQLKAMRAFVNVVDSGSFVGASRAMDLSPAVVTRSIAELEDSLGARLLTRTTRHVALTDIGKHYLERARAILHEVEEARALASSSVTVPQGHVRVRAAASFAVRQLAERLLHFHAAHPQVTVELTASGSVDSIDDAHDLTIAVRRDALQGGFVARRLARSEVLLCAQPGYLARAGHPRHPGDLASHRLLVSQGQARRPLTMFPRHDQSGGEVTVNLPAPALATANAEFNVAAALAGLGIAALPSYSAHEHLKSGELEQVLPDWRLFELTIWACIPSRKHVPAATRAFLDFLVREFGGMDVDRWRVSGSPA